jgi:hypothetical protein
MRASNVSHALFADNGAQIATLAQVKGHLIASRAI